MSLKRWQKCFGSLIISVVLLALLGGFFSRANADTITITNITPQTAEKISGGQNVKFTATVSYNLDSNTSGTISIYVRGVTPCNQLLDNQQRLPVTVQSGSGTVQISDTALIMCNDGVTHITKLKVGVILILTGSTSSSAYQEYDYTNIEYSDPLFPPKPGDASSDGNVDLTDAILALKIIAGLPVSGNPKADVNGDGRIGLEEVIYILQVVAGLRTP